MVGLSVCNCGRARRATIVTYPVTEFLTMARIGGAKSLK
jgi:hypothetical protein